MKKIFIVLAATTILVSCHQGKDNRCNTVIDNYLYGIEYDDYDFDACKEFFDSQYIPSGACSEVRRGNFIGRNLDWFINRNASAIIKMNHSDDHYASIGVIGCFPQFSDEIAKGGEFNEVYRYIPFKTEDGINECGLYVGVNVMPTGETSFDRSTWKHGEYGHSAAHTNPSAEMTCAVNYLPRILLDKAASVAEAMELIDSIDWTDPCDYPEKGSTQAFHWLISDPERSVVLEFIDNKAHYTEATSIKEPGFGTIMTNFTNCLWEAGIMQPNGIGYERFEVLRDNYSNYTEYPDTFEGMQKLMAQVWFTRNYTISLDSEDLWVTEPACDDFPADILYRNFEIANGESSDLLFGNERKMFNDSTFWYVDDTPLWFSTHTSVYDIAAKKLHLLVHEGRSGMKEFYEASLDSHFAKPLVK